MEDLWRLLRMAGGATPPSPPVPPGSTWVAHSPPSAYSGYSIAWSPELNLFVVVGTSPNMVFTSPNGTTWTQRSAPYNSQSAWTGVTWSPELGLFVAVADLTSNAVSTASTVMTSPDGINWTAQLGTAKGQWQGVTWSPELGLFVAYRFMSSNDGQPCIMTSTDGINWTARTYSGPTATNGFSSICWSPDVGMFIIGGRTGVYATSSDGVNWQTYTFPSSLQQQIYWSNTYGLFYATSGTYFWYSSNGLTWTQSTSLGSNLANVPSVDTGFNLLVILKNGSSAGIVWKSEDGMTWSSTVTGVMPNTAFWYGMAYSPSLNKAVAVGATSPYIATSP